MQFNTVVKLGSLALNVAQDEKVRELATMLHQGAKRRGLYAPYMTPPANQQSAGQVASVKSPTKQATKPAQKGQIPFSPNLKGQQGVGGMEKFLTKDNAKKVLDWAGIVTNLLVK